MGGELDMGERGIVEFDVSVRYSDVYETSPRKGLKLTRSLLGHISPKESCMMGLSEYCRWKEYDNSQTRLSSTHWVLI